MWRLVYNEFDFTRGRRDRKVVSSKAGESSLRGVTILVVWQTVKGGRE